MRSRNTEVQLTGHDPAFNTFCCQPLHCTLHTQDKTCADMEQTNRDLMNKATSSTAKGGGGSFKDRKPKGKVCSDAWTA